MTLPEQAGSGANRPSGSRAAPWLSPSLRLVIGLGLPFLAIVPTVPILSRLAWMPFGMPVAVVWLFGCIPFTAACLAVCWFAHDRLVAE